MGSSRPYKCNNSNWFNCHFFPHVNLGTTETPQIMCNNLALSRGGRSGQAPWMFTSCSLDMFYVTLVATVSTFCLGKIQKIKWLRLDRPRSCLKFGAIQPKVSQCKRAAKRGNERAISNVHIEAAEKWLTLKLKRSSTVTRISSTANFSSISCLPAYRDSWCPCFCWTEKAEPKLEPFPTVKLEVLSKLQKIILVWNLLPHYGPCPSYCIYSKSPPKGIALDNACELQK